MKKIYRVIVNMLGFMRCPDCDSSDTYIDGDYTCCNSCGYYEYQLTLKK